jgi:hypothetical protein
VINDQLPGTVGAHAVDYPQAYIMQWNTTLQKQFGANVVSVGYVGQVARHLQHAHNINIPPPSQAGLGLYNPRVVPGVMPNLASINYYTATGASEYNAAQLSFERRYDWGHSDIGIKHRISFRVNYEFPFRKNGSQMKKLATGGWQANLLASISRVSHSLFSILRLRFRPT